MFDWTEFGYSTCQSAPASTCVNHCDLIFGGGGGCFVAPLRRLIIHLHVVAGSQLLFTHLLPFLFIVTFALGE